MPRGVYNRKNRKGKVATVPEAPTNGGKKIADDVLQNVATIADTIKQAHSRIDDTLMEIGKHFYEIRQLFDGVPADIRRLHSVPSFTIWMNKTAPEVCGMTSRTAWHYYKNYSEAIAAGLKPETIIALAPTVLKNEKPRKAVFAAISRNPVLATQLNEAAAKHGPGPKVALRKIAESQEVKDLLKRIEAPPRSRVDRLETAIVNAYKPVFLADVFDLDAANKALEEFSGAVRNAAGKLRLGSHITLTFTPFTEVPAGVTPAATYASPEAEQNAEAILKQLAAAGYEMPKKRKAAAA